MAVTPAGARGQAGLPNIQAQVEADKKKKSDYAAKVQRQKDRLAAKKQLEANAGGAYGAVMGQIVAGSYTSGDPLKLTGRLLYQGKEVTANELLNKFYNWSPAEINAFDSKIKSLKIVDPSKAVDPDTRQNVYVNAVARASQFYALSNGLNKDGGSLEGTLLAYKGTGPGGSGAANLPDRRIQQIPDETLYAIIDKVSQSKLQKDITDPTQRASLLKKIKDQLAEGTVTTTKKVKNPKTGKLENVTVSSGMSPEDIQLQLGKDLEKSNAQDYELARTLEFNSILSKISSRSA
jgi:hypothetical protein